MNSRHETTPPGLPASLPSPSPCPAALRRVKALAPGTINEDRIPSPRQFLLMLDHAFQ